MVRENRIKNYNFSHTINTANVSLAGSEVINGEILEVHWSSNSAGSFWLVRSGAGEELWRRNAPSGTGYQVGRPYIFSESTTGSIAGARSIPFVIQDKLLLMGSAVSGTNTLDLTVYYR